VILYKLPVCPATQKFSINFLVEFALIVAIAGALKKGLLTKLIIADIAMIVFGYLGEIGTPGSVTNYLSTLIIYSFGQAFNECD
jgi:hypothetical protein